MQVIWQVVSKSITEKFSILFCFWVHSLVSFLDVKFSSLPYVNSNKIETLWFVSPLKTHPNTTHIACGLWKEPYHCISIIFSYTYAQPVVAVIFWPNRNYSPQPLLVIIEKSPKVLLLFSCNKKVGFKSGGCRYYMYH